MFTVVLTASAVFLAVLFTRNITALDPLLVSTPNGLVKGKHVLNKTTNATFWAWEGIPYGRPPVGKLRFQAPLPALPWEGVLDASHTRTPCIPIHHFQFDVDPGNVSEDCLNLNIYAPAKKFEQNIPVMLYILGGGNVAGDAIYESLGPDHLVENDVIVITFNFRVGMLGFLSTGDEHIPGNAALKDQLLALKWTHKNIEYFGGDPSKVTLFGASSGGISLGVFIWNKKAAGLFRAALCSSGSSLKDSKFQQYPRGNAYALAQKIDPTISPDLNTTEELKRFLQNADVDSIVEANKKLSEQTGFVVEVENEDGLITPSNSEAYAMLQSGEINQVPLLIGLNSEESLNWLGQTEDELKVVAKSLDELFRDMLSISSNEPNATNDLNSRLENKQYFSLRILPLSLHLADNANVSEVVSIIKETYIGNGTFENDIVKFLEFYSDMVLGRSILRQAQIQSKFQPVYLYKFSYYGTVSKIRKTAVIEGAGKVGHASEYPYVFKVATYPFTMSEDILISKKVARLWTNFAKYLNPTPNITDPLLDNVTWPTVTPDNLQYMDIDTVLSVKPNRKVKEMKMWVDLYQNYSLPPYHRF